MANNITVSRTIKGMTRDFHPMQLDELSYGDALNAVVEDFDGNGFPILQNEPSNILCNNFPTDYKVVGFVNIIEQNRVIWFLSNPVTGASEIGETQHFNDCRDYAKDGIIKGCDDCQGLKLSEDTPLEKVTQTGCCVYKTIDNQTCFNFSTKFPINSVEYRILECSLQIFIADESNSRRWVEFEYEDDDASKSLVIKKDFLQITGYNTPPCEDPVYGIHIDCNKMSIQPNIATPCIDFIDLVSGGSNKAGVYQFFIAFSDVIGNKLSSYVSSTNPIPIRTKDVTFATDYMTDRAIALNIDNLDPLGPYRYYKLAVAKTINNFTSFYEVGIFPVTQSRITYTGNEEAEVKVTEGDIFQRVPYYKSAGSVTASNDILFWANLKEFSKPNLQRVANSIKLNWQTIAIPEAVYRNPRNVNKFRGYMRDEVYPFGIQFIFNNGEESPAYHIPGRTALSTDLEIVSGNDVIIENNCDDCAEEVEPDAQITIPVEDLNTEVCPCENTGPTLNENNAEQAETCVLVPHSDTGCTPFVSGIGTPPIVNAGVDQTIPYTGVISLNGTVTPVAPASIVSIVWTQLSGPNTVTINNAGLAVTYFEGYDAGTYIFQLCATDSDANISVDTVQIDVTIPANNAPIADPGADKLVTLPSTVSYVNGASSFDTDGIASFAWSFISGPATPVISAPSAPYSEITGLTAAGTYIFELEVTDIRGCSSTAQTIIYVEENPCDEVPCCTSLLYPVNGSVTSSYSTVVLDWLDVLCVESYDVYLGADGDPMVLIGNTTDSTFVVNGLQPNTIYHWYVIPKNSIGPATDCDDCYRSFVTPITSTVNNCEKQRWEVYNTATIEGGDLELYKECEETCYQYGEFAYWESTERYPNRPEIWGSLCGQPIRHHKFPDSLVTHIHDGESEDQDYARNNVVYPIGVKVDHDSVRNSLAAAVIADIISAEDAARIVGYRIVRGNRFRNKSIVAKGLLYDVNQYKRKSDGSYFDNQDIFFANYPYNDLRANPFITDDFANYDNHNQQKGSNLPFIKSRRYTFHSPDTHFSEPTIGSKLKLETVEYGQSEGYFTKSKSQARQRFLSDTSYLIALATGLVAALIKTEEKQETVYTAKGLITSGMGVASGVLGPFLPYATGLGAAWLPGAGLDIMLNPTKAAEIGSATEVAVKTIQGKSKDWSNPVFLAIRRPELLPLFPLIFLSRITSFMSIVLAEIKIVLDLIESLTPYRDWTAQYHSVGKYNAFESILNSGNKIRSISSWGYLKGENSLISEPSDTIPGQFITTKVNNWHRESSVYLRYAGVDFPDAGTASGVTDDSRFTLEDGAVGCKFDKRVNKNISSYYASIKNYVPDQYGNIFNVEYIPTESCMFDMNASNTDCKGVYGGDTFINRFALKKKVPYFLADTFRLPDGTDFNFELYPNLAVPRHYYNSTLGIASEIDNISDIFSLFTPSGIATFLGRPKSIRDCQTLKFFYQNGYIYLYHYGIPYFLVESDVNVDYRHAENLQEKAFYPVQSDLDYWLQQENVNISEDNVFNYNNDYSKQNKETPIVIDGPDFEPSRECRVASPNRIIYATDSNWLTYKANDFFDFPMSKGKITSIEGIENETVLVRTINSTSIFKAFNLIPTDGETVQVGTGGVFKNKPQEFAETTLGYIGSQHKAIQHTEYGHITVDAKRGQIFNIAPGASSLDEISKNGLKNWFKENLPFRVLRDFQNMPEDHIDNAFNGAGICMAFDKRYNRLLVTKRDYKLKDKSVLYNPDTRDFYRVVNEENVIVKLGDKRYFKDASWTASYNFFTKSWVSYHSYKPNYYVDFIDFFGSGYNDGFWLHGITNASYQVFYGKLYPFMIEYNTKFEGPLKSLNSIVLDTEVRRYQNEYDYVVKSKLPGFNKAVVYNDLYNSGYLELIKTDKSKLSDVGKYPIRNLDNWNIELALSNYQWKFNQFYNLIKDGSELPQWIFDANNVDKKLNPQAFNYKKSDFSLSRLKGQWFKTRFVNDTLSNYKIISKFAIDNLTLSIR